MELKRDNQKDRGISVIHYDPDLFHNDQQFYLAYRKIERIVSALFLITGLIDKNDHLKQTLQEYALQSLSKFMSLLGKRDLNITDVQSVSALLLHLNSLLDIGFWSGQISQMNLTILQKEISATYKLLNEVGAKYKSTFFISSNFFKSDQELLSQVKTKDKSEEVYKGQDKGQYKRHAEASPIPQNVTIQDGGKGQRKEAILSLLRQRNDLTIKDFVDVVPECSEKTIQRELLALVEEGVVHKKGERRWSTYSLAS